MDYEKGTMELKLLLILFFLFFMSAYFSYAHIKYLIWGETTQATITDVREYSDGLAIYYTFHDENGKRVKARDTAPHNWSVPETNVLVQFLPGGTGESRLSRNSHNAPIWMLLACTGGLGYVGYRLHRAVNDPPVGRRRRR